MTIVWSDELKTGISAIDEQHQQLFETINRLDDLKKDKESFLKILIELQTYVSEHFKTEEEYMSYVNYPDYKTHKLAHDEFTEKYKSTLLNFKGKNGILELAPTLIELVENWITTHYKNEDVKMAAFLNKSRVS
jgi:hemerythrin